MTKPAHATALDILKLRNGEPTDVTLASGAVVRVFDIAEGYDLGDPIAHISTNIRPQREDHTIDFFFADEIVLIVDPENGAIWFELTGDNQERRSRRKRN